MPSEERIVKIREVVTKARPSDYKRMMGSEPKELMLLKASIKGFDGEEEERQYTIQRVHKHVNMYYSRVSSGQGSWTDKEAGPEGEPIKGHRKWILTAIMPNCFGEGYISSFEEFEDVVLFFLYAMKAKIVEIVGE